HRLLWCGGFDHHYRLQPRRSQEYYGICPEVCQDDRICGIIGGFHMPTVNRQTEETVRWLSRLRPKNLRPCHCTCFHARAAIHQCVPIGDTCVADVLEF
ncbi:MAG: hypothetical protein J6J51_02070, partial [Clostridia bacterium]|nr:hypothetical protein [Clostridia bacterium]